MSRKLRICIDLDGTICEIRKDGESYAEVKIKPGAKEMIKSLHDAGHTIIINTARNMGSTGHNIGKALKNVGKMTFDWLDKNGVIYDEIFFGKPNADITIDDRCVAFRDWQDISESLLLKEAKEK